jgi:hypothetical protein
MSLKKFFSAKARKKITFFSGTFGQSATRADLRCAVLTVVKMRMSVFWLLTGFVPTTLK